MVDTDQYYSTEFRRRFPLMGADLHSCRFAPNRFKVEPDIEFSAPDASRSARKSASRPYLQMQRLAANFANKHESKQKESSALSCRGIFVHYRDPSPSASSGFGILEKRCAWRFRKRVGLPRYARD